MLFIAIRNHVRPGVYKKLWQMQIRCAATQAQASEAKRAGDISDAFVSLAGGMKDAEPLDDHYRVLKEELLGRSNARTKRDQVERGWNSSWCTLLENIKRKAAVIEKESDSYVPTIDFDDIQKSAYRWHEYEQGHAENDAIARLQSFMKDYRERGVAVVRNVIPSSETLNLKDDLQNYISQNSKLVKGFPSGPNKQVYELYWSKAQITARAHPRMLLTQQFLLSFWHAKAPGSSEDAQVINGLPSIAALPVTYADRLRMRQPGDSTFALGPHVDGGSVERWEAEGYGRGNAGKGTYASVFGGDWRAHDAWYWPGRIEAESDVYKGVGACSMFRAAQGWLAMSAIGKGEGHLMVNPLLKEALAYWLMRPFFEAVRPVEEIGEETWVDAGNWRLEENVSSKIHGATPGFGQEINPVLHPHLLLDKTMIHMPPVKPGDYVVWHCDTIHAVDAKHNGKADSNVLYIPVCPWTEENLRYAQKQLQTFVAAAPSPDFGGGSGERGFQGQITVDQLNDMIGQPGRWAMGVLEDRENLSEVEKAQKLYEVVLQKARNAGSIDWSHWH